MIVVGIAACLFTGMAVGGWWAMGLLERLDRLERKIDLVVVSPILKEQGL